MDSGKGLTLAISSDGKRSIQSLGSVAIVAIWTCLLVVLSINSVLGQANQHDSLTMRLDVSLDEPPEHKLQFGSYLKFGHNSHCGIYSLHGAAKALGVDIEIAPLLSSRYIGSHRGSSLSDLVRAANDVGLFATPLSNLDIQFLRTANTPVLLLMQIDRQGEGLFHWVTLLGVSDSAALILDPPAIPTDLSWPCLMSNWTGVGISVSRERFTAAEVIGIRLVMLHRVLPIALILVVSTAVWTALQRRLRCPRNATTLKGLAIQQCVVLTVTISGIWLHAHLDRSSYFANYRLLPYIACNSSKSNGHKSSIQHVPWNAANSPDAVIIDCRMAPAFAMEHVPGARNLPINADVDTVYKFAREASPQLEGRQLYVFCQSDKCPWADIMATRLTCLGMENVNVLHGGIDAWRSIARISTPKS